MIHMHFDRQFPEGLLDSWTPTRSTNSSLDSLDISNRYLTPLRDVSGGLVESIPFHKGVDPRNVLRDMAKDDHIHTEDNYVEYFSMRRDNDGHQRFQSCEPQMFRVGDIVQVQLSFVVIPVKAGRRRMLTVLRSLALLDAAFTIKMGEKTRMPPVLAVPTLKRKVGYNDSEEKRNDKRDKMLVDQASDAQ